MIGTRTGAPAIDPRIMAALSHALSGTGVATGGPAVPPVAPPIATPPPPPSPMMAPAAAPMAPDNIDARGIGDVLAAVPATGGMSQAPAGPEITPHRGFFDKFGDWFHAPGTSGALLRSAGATMQGGLGAGIQAGSEYMDHRDAASAAKEQWQAEQGLKTRSVDINQQATDQAGEHQRNQDEQGYMGVANDTTKLAIDDYRARMEAALKAQGIQVDLKKIEQDDVNNRRTTGASIYGTQAGERNSERSASASMYGADRSFAGTKYSTDGRSYDEGRKVAAAGIGSKPHNPSKAALNVEVLPANAQPSDLTVGHVYRTARGLGQWNGSAFVPVQ